MGTKSEVIMVKGKLPEGWELTTLGGIGTVGSSRRVRKNDWKSEGIPFYRAREIAKLSREGSVKNDLFITNDLFEELSKSGQTPETRDLMITGVGTIGVPYIVKNTDKFYFKDASVLIFKKADCLLTEYLFYFFISEICRREIMKGSKGTTVDTLTISRASNLDVPLPPLAEQKRIVTKIEELFSELDAGEESFKQARKQLGIYRQSLLKQAFEGKLTQAWRANNPEQVEDPKALLKRIQQEREARHLQQVDDWESAVELWEVNGKNGRKPSKPTKLVSIEPVAQKKLLKEYSLPLGWVVFEYGKLCSIIRNGLSAKPSGTKGNKIARISAVRPMFFNYADYRFLDCEKSAQETYALQQGDLIFTRYNGARRYVGVCAYFSGKEPRLYPDKLIRTCPNLPSLSGQFLELSMNSGLSRDYIESKIRTTAGQSGVSGGDIKATPAIVCALPEQKEIVRLLEAQFTVIEQNEREIDAALKRSAALRQSILKKAFSGQLAPQNPADEPASVLLERIRAEKSEK